ncbi:MAG: DegT/DnrJ/EryC1/StrS family aminotransferase, partial [Treponema sp.]|nr:DegT/DnrJ/EryC1/StrS family aminotransferase [Treponema sp.]
GLGISMHFIAIFNFSWWKEKYPEYTPERFPNAQRHYQNTITIPLWPYMSDEMSDYVIATIKKVGERHHV